MKKFAAKITGLKRLISCRRLMTLKALICAGLIALTGCVDYGNASSSTKVHGDAVIEHVTHEYGGPEHTHKVFNIHKFEYEGHTYLYFKESFGHNGYAGLTHDENCKCRKHVSDN